MLVQAVRNLDFVFEMSKSSYSDLNQRVNNLILNVNVASKIKQINK